MTVVDWNAKTTLLRQPEKRGILNTIRAAIWDNSRPPTASNAKHRADNSRPSYSTIAIRHHTVPAILNRKGRQ